MFVRLFAATVAVMAAPLSAQDVLTIAKTTDVPREAFLENAPLAEFAFDGALFNAKEQRLREHYLETPLGPAPAIDPQEAAVQPLETPVDGREAGIGVAIRQNRGLSDAETNNSTSNVCEPSLAVRGQEVLYTGNWFAAFSRNGGTTFSFRNPETSFPSIPNRPFCCDQVALYVPSHDLMVWFLQYGKDTTGNTVRLAVAAGADIAAERWRFYDFTPQDVGSWANEWFDYPDLAHSDQHLFVTTNCFTLTNSFARSVCLRIPLSELATYAALNYRYFDLTDLGSLRPAQGARGTMYIGAHESTASIRVYSWADAATNVPSKSFAVQSWVRGGAAAACPDGRDWLGFVDGRITGAWTAGSAQGFAWTSAQDGSYPWPHARVAVLDYNAGTVTSQPHIWNSGFAFAYPGAAANSAGQVGVCLSYGGNTLFVNPAVGVMNGANWAITATGTGTHGPDRNRWGDYQTVRLNGQSPNRFASTAFSLSGGPARTDIVPRLVQFDAVATESEVPEEQLAAATVHKTIKPVVPKLQLVPEVAFATTVAQNGLRFSSELYASNQSRRDQVLDLTRTLAGRTGLGSGPAMCAIPLNALDNAPDLAAYAELVNLPDIGDFFFAAPESVCEPDERMQVTDTGSAPWNGNCQLFISLPDGSRARGTGWFLTPQVVVTAGHCVHEGDGGSFFSQVEVIPGMNGPARPFGSQIVAATALRASTGWKEDGKIVDDYGVILLSTPFAGVTTTPVQLLSDPELQAATLTLSGYPADKPTGTQWVHSGVTSSVQPRRLHYMIDTYGGHSGSAVVTLTATGQIAVGIHNYGGCPNKCTRITDEVLQDIKNWQNGQ